MVPTNFPLLTTLSTPRSHLTTALLAQTAPISAGSGQGIPAQS